MEKLFSEGIPDRCSGETFDRTTEGVTRGNPEKFLEEILKEFLDRLLR